MQQDIWWRQQAEEKERRRQMMQAEKEAYDAQTLQITDYRRQLE